MSFLLTAFFVSGLSFLFILTFGEFFIYKETVKVETKCSFSVYLAAFLMLYLFTNIILVIGGFATGKFYALLYVIFAFLPFIIGEISNYEHVKLYTNIQIAAVLIGCVISYYNLLIT